MHGNNITASRRPAPLEPDAEMLGRFIRVVFKHATAGGFVSLRAFPPEAGEPPVFIRTFVIEKAGFDNIISGAMIAARRAAKHRAVFSPPVAVFKTPRRARGIDLSEGVVISVECDANPKAALKTLKAILGPPTLVIRSGGIWCNPETDRLEDKLHLYWRLAVPARDAEGFGRLKEALKLATGIVGGDASNTTPVHPLRWPGSWHLKAKPRLCRIIEQNDVEVDLNKALKLLRAAAPSADLQRKAAEKRTPVAGTAKTMAPSTQNVNHRVVQAALDSYSSNCSYWVWFKTAAALRHEFGEAGFDMFDRWSAKSPKQYNKRECAAKWKAVADVTDYSIGTIFYFAEQANPGWRAVYEAKLLAKTSSFLRSRG
jgi:hypothetical protein